MSRVYVRKEDTPHRIYMRGYANRWAKTLRGRWNRCGKSAKHRGIEFNLPYEFFCYIVTCSCDYCGDKNPDGYVGVDRVDNSIGYTPANVVPCCTKCNRMKSDMDRNEFIDRCAAVCAVAKKDFELTA